MGNIRIVLWGVFAALLFLCYQTWQTDYGAPAPSAQTAASAAEGKGAGLGDTVPQPDRAASAASAATPPVTASTDVPAAGAAPALPPATDTVSAGTPLHVVTDVLDVSLNLKGGDRVGF